MSEFVEFFWRSDCITEFQLDIWKSNSFEDGIFSCFSISVAEFFWYFFWNRVTVIASRNFKSKFERRIAKLPQYFLVSEFVGVVLKQSLHQVIFQFHVWKSKSFERLNLSGSSFLHHIHRKPFNIWKSKFCWYFSRTML